MTKILLLIFSLLFVNCWLANAYAIENSAATNTQTSYGTTSNTGENANSSSDSLVNQLAEQNTGDPSAAIGPSFGQTLNGIATTQRTNETYAGLRQFWYLDIFSFFSDAGIFFSNFFSDLPSIYLPYLVGVLCTIVKSFFLNTDLTKVNDVHAINDLSTLLTQLANTIYSIALDLSLLLFILSIWRYWTHAAWSGSGGLMGSVGRLIATMGVLLSWPTIYRFQIGLSNEMLNALFNDSNGQTQSFDTLMSTLLHNASAIPHASLILPAVPATEYVPEATDTMKGIIALAPPIVEGIISIIVCFLAIILIYELFYLIVLKAIQTALLTAQYVFAPFFLVFLANPVTDNIATSYLRTFVEVSLWNFIWIGLLKILIILLYSNFNPWSKILTTIGVLQLMMNVPQFLSHAKISVASDFVSPHFFAKALKDISSYDQKFKKGTDNMRIFFGGAPTRGHAKEKSDTSMPGNDNFSFTGNSGNTIAPPPLKSGSSSDKQETNAAENNRSNPQNKDSPTLGKGFNFTSATKSQSRSSTNSFNGNGIAFAQASSSSNAMAIVNINSGSMGNSAVNNPPPKPPGPTHSAPTPSGPTPSGPTPSRTTPANPTPPSPMPLSPAPSSPKPSAPIPPSGNPPLTNAGTSPSKASLRHPNNNADKILKQHSISDTANLIKSSSPRITNASNQSLASRLPLLPTVTLETLNTNTSPSLQKEPANTPIALNQTSAFQFGSLNYYQKKGINPLINGIFQPSPRTYGAAGACLNQYAYNLIFNHGNSPPLMGIPPIYPDPNRN